MALRAPQNYTNSFRVEPGRSALERELLSETAANLGRLGKAVETTLAALADSGAARGSEDRRRLVKDAAWAVWCFFIQRESCGMADHRGVIAHYGIPGEVLARLGAMD